MREKNKMILDLVLIYIIVINIASFLVFGLDKWKAKKGKWRIREASLMGMVAIGGSLGGFAAMRLFRHKTRKRLFAVGVPLILFLQLLVVIFVKIILII